MAIQKNIPAVQLIGEVDHPDFREAIALLRRDSRFIATEATPPELIVVAQSRPDATSSDQLNHLRRTSPLAGVVALVGSWCEGETRTGRPWPGIQRSHWYEFPTWWHRQLQLRAANLCPDWARPTNQLTRRLVPGHPPSAGLIVLRTMRRDNAAAIADTLQHDGYATVWQSRDRASVQTRGAFAGVWDGGQLSEPETVDLASFCQQMSRDNAPVVAILDFPRRDRVDRAYEAGAAAVLGKPWLSVDLVAALEFTVETKKFREAA